MKTNEELIIELNVIRASQRAISSFSSMEEFMANVKEVCVKKAAILDQIEANCNPGLTKDQIWDNYKADWKANGVKSKRA